MKCLITIMLLLVASQTYAQDLYIQTFGNQKDTPIIYLHGGPGYNSTSFEATTAEKIAQEGFFVIVYDRRGEGRSQNLKAAFNFEETLADLNNLYGKFELEKVTLIGHSFGGIIATLFAEKYPQKINRIILLSAPIALQETFQTIIDSTELIYQTKEDKMNLNYISMLKKMDKQSLEYSSYCFMHAMSNGFYTPKKPTAEAQAQYAAYGNSSLAKYANQLSYTAPKGFWENEQYTSIDLTENLSKLVASGIDFYGIYGQEDGLFSTKQIQSLQAIIGAENVAYLDNCAHNPYLDRQKYFLDFLTNLSK